MEAGLIVAFWSLIILLNIAQRAFDTRHGSPIGLEKGEGAQALVEYAVWALLTPLFFWLSRRFSLEEGRWLRHLLLHFMVALVASFALDYYGWETYVMFVETSRNWSLTFSQRIARFLFLDELIALLAVVAAGFARDYFLRYQAHLRETVELRTRSAELQVQLSESRFQTLRMQLNPHFLFNTLHTISTYLERDPRGVRRMIARLSKLLRYTLEKTDVKEVPLRQELGFINDYLEIEQIRFEDSLEVTHDIAPEVLDAMVPNLILQPIVENAIKHGIGNRERDGRIEIRAWREDEWLHLSVSDNGPGLVETQGDGAPHAPAETFGVGLRNTSERLESLYGEAQSISLEHIPAGGARAHIALPYHTAADLVATGVASELVE